MKCCISIIVPVYNVEKYLSRCVESFLHQTFTDFELILVDDESPDKCGEICDEYAKKDSRIKVIHKTNGGVSSARNAGIDVAVGKYIMFCDSDDYVRVDWLETHYSLITDKKVDSVATGFSVVDDNNVETKGALHPEKLVEFQDDNHKMEYFISDVFQGKTGWEVCTRIFKLDLIKKFDIRFCATCENYAEDLSFVFQYLLVSKSNYISSYDGYLYYQRADSMMHTAERLIKLNALNEVSHFLYQFLRKTFINSFFDDDYPIIHYLLMYTEYRKFFEGDFSLLPQEIKKIMNINWYNKQTKKILFCYNKMKKYFGKKNASRIIVFSRYCIHKNYKRFQMESGINYKLFNR